MTSEDIIRMAREAELYEDGQFFVCKHDELERFFFAAYAAGAAAEREACASLLDANGMRCGEESLSRLILETNAAAIRARGNT